MYGDPPFDLIPPAACGGQECTFTSDDPAIALVSGSTVTIVAPGSARICAIWVPALGEDPVQAVATLSIDPHPGCVMQGGLIWLKPDNQHRSWSAAANYCAALFGGNVGWRLPTASELSSFLNSMIFRRCDWPPNYYWTSTPGANGHHRVVEGADGEICENDDDSLVFPVIPVRVNPVRASAWERYAGSASCAELVSWELVHD